MNAVTTTAPTKLDQFRMEILPPERRQELFAGMPPHVRPERFERNLVNALMQNPELMTLDARLVFREVSKAAALGLYLDPQLGEAYLIIGWNGKAKRKEPQLRIGYRGLIKLGRQSGEISMMYAHEVHKNDVFKASLGDHKSLTHEPDVFGDRGEIVGYYAVVKYKDGETDFEPLTVPQAHGIRDRSDGWKAFKEGKIKSTPWSTDEVEMSKKTAIRRLTKRIPQSPELAEALKIEDAAEHVEMQRVAPPAPPRPPVPPMIDGPVEEPEVVDAETGEVIDERETVVETGEATDALVDEQSDTLGDYFTKLEQAMEAATNAADIAEVWNDFDPLAKFEGDEDSQALATSIKRKHVQRVGAK
jgi:recombination protein RecT